MNDGNRNYKLITDAIIEGAKGTTLRLNIRNVFSNPRQVTFSNESVKPFISNEGYAIGRTDPAAKIFIEPTLSKEELREVTIE